MSGSVSRGSDGQTVFNPDSIQRQAFDYYARLGRVKRYVEAHYDERLTLATTARVAGFEKTYFSAWFHARAGVRYRDWLSWVRICQALRLMRETDSSLTDICFAVGFGDLRTFERAFERCTGECPRSARRHATTVSLAHAAKLTNPKI